MKGLSTRYPFSLLYSLCICICFHVFILCTNMNSQINADSLKPTRKTPGFLPEPCYSTNTSLFSPVSVAIAICVSELKRIFAVLEDDELYLRWYSTLLKAGCHRMTSRMITPKLRPLCSSAWENSQRKGLCLF